MSVNEIGFGFKHNFLDFRTKKACDVSEQIMTEEGCGLAKIIFVNSMSRVCSRTEAYNGWNFERLGS
jgi:hypothetical protein